MSSVKNRATLKVREPLYDIGAVFSTLVKNRSMLTSQWPPAVVMSQ